MKSKDITSKTLHAKFYASRIKNKRVRRGVKYVPPPVWSVFKSPGKIGLTLSSPGGSGGLDGQTHSCQSETSYPMMPKLGDF